MRHNPRNRNKARAQSITSSCGNLLIRGTVDQVIAKHTELGNDAAKQEDYVLAETHYQHAEHYRRVKAEANHARNI